MNLGRNTVGAKKAKRDRKQHIVTHQQTQQKQQIDCDNHLNGISPLALVERRRDKTEKLIDDIWRCAQQ